jgi:predicted NBD/HSP70 family sugar kinase
VVNAAIQGLQGTDLKTLNARMVLRALLDSGAATAPELATRLGLSKPTVAAALKRLEGAGLVLGLGTQSGSRGRSPALWGVDVTAGAVIGIDLGTRVVQAGIADLGGTVLARHLEPLGGATAAELAAALDRAVNALLRDSGVGEDRVVQLTVGIPGAVDPREDTVHLSANLPALSDPAATAELRERFSSRLELVKDVYLAARGEAAARGPEQGDFALMTIGRGISAAIVHNGEPLTGTRGFSGEIGYLPLTPFGADAPGRAPLEEAASTSALLAEASARGLGADDIAQLAASAGGGDDAARELLAREVALIAHAAAALAIAVDPPLFVLTGSIPLAAGEPFAAQLHARLVELLPLAAPPVELARAGSEATVRGALAVAVASSWERIIESLESPRGQKRP